MRSAAILFLPLAGGGAGLSSEKSSLSSSFSSTLRAARRRSAASSSLKRLEIRQNHDNDEKTRKTYHSSSFAFPPRFFFVAISESKQKLEASIDLKEVKQLSTQRTTANWEEIVASRFRGPQLRAPHAVGENSRKIRICSLVLWTFQVENPVFLVDHG